MTTSRSRAAHTGANEGTGSDPALAGSARRTSASAPSEMFRQLLPNDVCMRRLQLADADRHGVRDRGFCLGEATRHGIRDAADSGGGWKAERPSIGGHPARDAINST